MSSIRSSRTALAALTAAGLLGGGAALGGAALFGAFAGGTTTVVERITAQPTSAPVPVSSGADLTAGEIYRRYATGVVQITTTAGGQQQGLGSGFVLDKAGNIVTNYHVVQGAGGIEVSFSNQDTLSAKLVGVDPSTDLAVLKVDAGARALTPLPIGNSERVRVGDPVVAIGNPFGLERTVTAGIVSALQRRITAPNDFSIDHVIQTDAPINSGNSGGPLLNARGEVIGVNSQIETGGSGGNVGIGFAVPSNTVKSVVAQILAKGRVDHAYIGVSVRELEPGVARELRLPVEAGLLVERIFPGSPAERANLRGGSNDVVVAGEGYRMGGDVIVSVGGEKVTTFGELRDAIAARKPGDDVKLEIYRGQAKRTVTVKLGRQPNTRTS